MPRAQSTLPESEAKKLRRAAQRSAEMMAEAKRILDAEITRLVDAGYEQSAIARALDLTPAAISKRLGQLER